MNLLKRASAWYLGFFYFFYFALVAIYLIFLPKMLMISGYSAAEVGIIFSASPLMRFILPFILKRYGSVDIKIYSYSLAGIVLIVSLFFIFYKVFWVFLFLNLLYGAVMGVILPYVDTIALNLIGKELYGRVRLWGSIGFMTLALVLGKILHSPLEALGFLALVSLGVAISGSFLAKYDKADEVLSQSNDFKEFSILRHWAFWASAFLLQVSFGGFYNFFTIYETAHGISLELTSWLWSFGVICEILMLYFQGPLLKGNLLVLIELSIFTTVIRWLILWLFPDSLIMAFISQSFHALNFALYYTASIAYIYELYSQKKLAQQFFLGITFGLGGAVGALIAGWVYEFKPSLLFLSQALIAFLSWILIYIHLYRKRRYVSK